jgi:oligoendopeptidase F
MKTFAMCAAMLLSTAFAQEPAPFAAFPNGAARYHLDFSRIFATPEAEKADRAVLARELEALQAMRGSVTADGDHLLAALERRDAVRVRVARHAMYLYLRYAVDTRDEKSSSDDDALEAEADAKSAFVDSEIMAISDARLAQLVAAQPKLATYRYALESIRRWRPHTLPEPEEQLWSSMAPAAVHWQYDLWEKLRSRSAPASGQNSPDRALREAAFRKRWADLAQDRDLYAFALLRLASSRNALARLRHFDDAAAWSYFRRDLTRASVKSLLDRVAANAEVYKRYQRLRAEHVRAAMGYSDANVWDLGARPAGIAPPRFTIDEARRAILEATAPLGEEYAAQLRALLDPANGRMDIVPGPHRKSGGFSEGTLGTQSVFFAGGFTGTYNDVRVLAHESTHAVQRQLMDASGVPLAYTGGPSYLAEALAIFNELLLADTMAAHDGDPFYLEQFLDGKGMAAFSIAPEAELEEAVYDGVAAGTIHGPDDLDALTKRIYIRYTIWPEKHDELKGQWMAVPLMYEDPFYDVNYVYGAIIALRMYASYSHDPKAFAPRYVAMMKNGYTAPPAVLLKQFFGIDLDDPLDDVVHLLDARVAALRAAYARETTGAPPAGRHGRQRWSPQADARTSR